MPSAGGFTYDPRDRGLATQSLEAFALIAAICAQKSKANSLEKGITQTQRLESRVYNENIDRMSPCALTNSFLSIWSAESRQP
jgi:hypothetical protein